MASLFCSFGSLFKSAIVLETVAIMPWQFILLITPSTISPVNSSEFGAWTASICERVSLLPKYPTFTLGYDNSQKLS